MRDLKRLLIDEFLPSLTEPVQIKKITLPLEMSDFGEKFKKLGIEVIIDPEICDPNYLKIEYQLTKQSSRCSG